MLRRIHALLLAVTTAALAIAGCRKPGLDVFAEAEALEAQGKLEEAAARFELTCVHAPGGDRCAAADGRAAEARIKAAEEAMTEGRFVAAERLFTRALTTADDAAAKKIDARLSADDLKQGLAYQRALERTDLLLAFRAMEKIAATPTPVAVRAQAWLDKERPRVEALPRPKAAPTK